MKKIINVMFLILFPLYYWGCNSDKSTYNIRDKSSIKIVGQYGEIEIDFKDESMMVSQISIFDKNKKLIYNQFGENDGLMAGSSIRDSGDSTKMRKFRSYSLDREKLLINDTLVEEIYNDLYTTRELVSNGRILYLEMYQNNMKRSNVLNFKLLDYEWIDDNNIKILIKNYFPFNGDFKFYYPNTDEKLLFRKIDQNLYLVDYFIEDNSKKVLFDVEILPSNTDSLLRTVFTQQIMIEK
ncbi:hypothetical protein [Algoriphagus namhaensis]